MNTVRDRLWIWGHPAGSHNKGWGLPRPSRMTPLEGACYLGVPNLVMVRYEDKPDMPFDQYAIPFRALKQVYWSVVGSSGRTSEEERGHVLELAERFPNIVGLFMDDFFLGHQADPGVLSVEQLRAVKQQMQALGCRLNLGVTLYAHQLDAPVGPYLKLCDHVSLWTWKAPDLDDLTANFQTLERLAPRSGKLLGLYMWDYGLRQPMPVEAMEMQCEMGLGWLREGRIDGMIFLASCICDLGLDAVEWTRDWIRGVGETPLSGRVTTR